MIVLDSNILIGYFRSDERIIAWLEREMIHGTSFAMSTVTVVEILGYHKIIPYEITLIQRWLNASLVVSVDRLIADEEDLARVKELTIVVP